MTDEQKQDMVLVPRQVLESIARSSTDPSARGFAAGALAVAQKQSGMLPSFTKARIQQAIDAAAPKVAAPMQEQPVLVVEREPDYWSRGHFHEGTKPYVDPTKVWKLPIGTALYAAPQAQPTAPAAQRVTWRWMLEQAADHLDALYREAKGDGGNPKATFHLADDIRTMLAASQAQPAQQDAKDAAMRRWLAAQHFQAAPIAQVVWKRSSDLQGEWVNLIDGHDLIAHVERAAMSSTQQTEGKDKP